MKKEIVKENKTVLVCFLVFIFIMLSLMTFNSIVVFAKKNIVKIEKNELKEILKQCEKLYKKELPTLEEAYQMIGCIRDNQISEKKYEKGKLQLIIKDKDNKLIKKLK